MSKKEKVNASESVEFNTSEKLAETFTPVESQNNQPDTDPFEPVNTGDFEVWDTQTKPELIARFVGTGEFEGFEDQLGQPKEMLKFIEHGTEKLYLADPSYHLYKLFVKRVSETPIKWDLNPTFKIKFTGKEDIGGGRSVKNYVFKVAYL